MPTSKASGFIRRPHPSAPRDRVIQGLFDLLLVGSRSRCIDTEGGVDTQRRSDPAFNLGIRRVPRRFQTSGGTIPLTRTVRLAAEIISPKPPPGWSRRALPAATRLDHRTCVMIGYGTGLRRRTLQALRPTLCEQVHVTVKCDFVHVNQLVPPDAREAAIRLLTGGKAQLAPPHELRDLSAQDHIRIEEASKRPVQEALPQTGQRPGATLFEGRRPVRSR